MPSLESELSVVEPADMGSGKWTWVFQNCCKYSPISVYFCGMETLWETEELTHVFYGLLFASFMLILNYHKIIDFNMAFSNKVC